MVIWLRAYTAQGRWPCPQGRAEAQGSERAAGWPNTRSHMRWLLLDLCASLALLFPFQLLGPVLRLVTLLSPSQTLWLS